MKKIFTSPYTYVVLVIGLIALYWKYGMAKPAYLGFTQPGENFGAVSGDGGAGTDAGNGDIPIGTPPPLGPTTVTFRDFAAMRSIGNDGKRPGEGITTAQGGQRPISDPYYNATGFLVPQGTDISAFTVGQPVRVKASTSVDTPHFSEGIFTLKAKFPAIPGVGTDQRGTWLVTDATWSNGSTGKEPGIIQQL